MNPVFDLTSIPFQGGCRWFVKRGDEFTLDRGFRSKREASDWIDSLGDRLDWRAGFTFHIKGDSTHMEIVSRSGGLAKY